VGSGEGAGYVIPSRYWRWVGKRTTLVVLLWVVTLGGAAQRLRHALTWDDTPPDAPAHTRRADGNGAHTHIDFGGQWTMGRMLVLGHGRELYHRQRQWQVVRSGFPVADEAPIVGEEGLLPSGRRVRARPKDDIRHDADRLMESFMGADPPREWKTAGGAVALTLAAEPFGNPFAAAARQHAAAQRVTPELVETLDRPAIGGPLYPPVHALLYAPIGLFARAGDALPVFQVIAVGFAFLAGLGISLLSRGRIWWSVASLVVLLYPGCRAGIDLGQNQTISLAILTLGWALAVRGRETAGGMVWGLFAFKPVWGVAFFLAPLLMLRWRFCLAMGLTGAALAAATLPFVGVQSWLDWLEVGKEAADLYNVNEKWINLSRDLQGIPRRALHDFTLPEPRRDTELARTLAWGLWGTVFGGTVAVYLCRGDRRQPTGLAAGFLFLGAFLSCYRFMYYDVVLSAVALAVLFADPARFFRSRLFTVEPVPPTPAPAPFGPRRLGYVNSFPLTVLVLLLCIDNVFLGANVQATVGFGHFARPTTGAGGSTGLEVPRVRAEMSVFYPWDTVMLLGLWLWCGWRLVRDRHDHSPSCDRPLP
jgi:hypothetical protein